MNRRSFLTVFGLAPVVGVMAARDAMAAPVPRTYEFSALLNRESFFIGERVGESYFVTPNQARKILGGTDEIFGVDSLTGHEDRILSAYRTTRDEPGVAI